MGGNGNGDGNGDGNGGGKHGGGADSGGATGGGQRGGGADGGEHDGAANGGDGNGGEKHGGEEHGGGDRTARPRRVVVLGTTGSGKSTLAARVAAVIGAAHVELDGFNHGPKWTPRPQEEFAASVAELAARPRWVADGNYLDRVSGVLWPRADLVVWLDVPLRVLLPRIVRRTVVRVVRRTELWNGNREQWSALFGRHSLLLWAVRSQRRHRTELPGRLAALAAAGVRVVRLRSATEADRWLAELARTAA